MSVTWLLKNLLGNLLLPPSNVLILLALALFFRKHRWSLGLALFAGLLLLAQSLPPVAGALISTLETRAGPVLIDPQGAQAIVILGSGLDRNAEEYGGDTVNHRSLVRLRYGATLAQRYGLPVLISGGTPVNAKRSEAAVMGDVLEREFDVPVRWRESKSVDTAENAIFSAERLRADGIQRIILVTQAFHLPRARKLFEATGLEVIPAPTDFKGRRRERLSPADWLPQAYALHDSYYALHEWVGLAWAELVRRWNTARK